MRNSAARFTLPILQFHRRVVTCTSWWRGSCWRTILKPGSSWFPLSRDADLSHPAFRYLADPIDLLRAPLLLNHYYFLDAAFLPYRQMSYFVQTYFPGWFGVSRTFRKDYIGTGFDTTYSFYLPSGKLVDRYYVMPQDKLEAGSREWINELGQRMASAITLARVEQSSGRGIHQTACRCGSKTRC